MCAEGVGIKRGATMGEQTDTRYYILCQKERAGNESARRLRIHSLCVEVWETKHISLMLSFGAGRGGDTTRRLCNGNKSWLKKRRRRHCSRDSRAVE